MTIIRSAGKHSSSVRDACDATGYPVESESNGSAAKAEGHSEARSEGIGIIIDVKIQAVGSFSPTLNLHLSLPFHTA